MKKTILCLSILLAVFTATSAAQEPSMHSNGFDADLYNGTIYNFGSTQIRGHQFLEKEMFSMGTVTIGEHTFSDLFLNYDIVNQEVLLKSGEGFQQKVISLPVDILKSFTIGSRRFIIVFEEPRDVKIYETIGTLDRRFLRYWTKEIKTSTDNSVYNFVFSKPLKTTFLSDGKSIYKLKRRKDFLTAFPETQRAELKRFIRKNHIHFRKASSDQLKKLINYCNTL